MTYIKPVVQDANPPCNAAILGELLKSYPSKWRNVTLRAIFTSVLIFYFCWTVYTGPIAIITTTVVIQVKCFLEIMNIGYETHKIPSSSWFRLVPCYFLFVVNYFCFGETMGEYFSVFIEQIEVLRLLVLYHRFLSFCLYFLGLIFFVFSLVRKQDAHQFCILTWTHLALFVIVAQSYMIVKNLFQGLIWLVLPVSMVVCNDIMAFVVGKFCGRTQLTELSPKKTWEGFIGGGIFTLIHAVGISSVLCKYQYFICPLEYAMEEEVVQLLYNCTPSSLFTVKNYSIVFCIFDFVNISVDFSIYPFIVDSIFLALFSSVIAPFGGIFASGFKRAFKVKDFANTIPGHGGILDRFDCQYLMATFVNVYISSFVKHAVISPEKILTRVLYMKPEQQLKFFQLLQDLVEGVGSRFINSTDANAAML